MMMMMMMIIIIIIISTIFGSKRHWQDLFCPLNTVNTKNRKENVLMFNNRPTDRSSLLLMLFCLFVY